MEDNKVVKPSTPRYLTLDSMVSEIRGLQEQLNDAIIRAKKVYRLDSIIVTNNTKTQIDAIVITKSY